MPQTSRPISDASLIVVASDQVSSALGDEVAVVSLENGVYYGLDPVGARIWRALSQPMTFIQLRDALLCDYDVDRSALERDMRVFLGQLAEQGLIEITP